MAKKKSKKELDLDNLEGDEAIAEEGGKKGGKITGIVIAVLIIAIWLVIFGLLIKMDVGGFGSTVLSPLLKNVPVVNRILPEPATGEETAKDDNGTGYKSMSEAIAKINELEQELKSYQDSSSDNSDKIGELNAEVSRLKTFEDNQNNFDELKKKFDEQVVFSDKAPDISEYKTWYESIDSENAAALYKEVVQKLNATQQVKDWADAYAKMEPANAAKILQEMSGDMNLVSAILSNMKTSQRGEIMAQMDPVFAAKVTKIMYPE